MSFTRALLVAIYESLHGLSIGAIEAGLLRADGLCKRTAAWARSWEIQNL